MNDYLKTKELYHHGIKGQKWGIRRYQNEDGTLTEEGRKKVTNHLGRMGTSYFTTYGAVKDKVKTYTFLRENNIVTDDDVKKQRELEDKYSNALKKVKIDSTPFGKKIASANKQEHQKLNKMADDILANLQNISTKFLNTNESYLLKKQVAIGYLRTLMYNDDEYYKKGN